MRKSFSSDLAYSIGTWAEYYVSSMYFPRLSIYILLQLMCGAPLHAFLFMVSWLLMNVYILRWHQHQCAKWDDIYILDSCIVRLENSKVGIDGDDDRCILNTHIHWQALTVHCCVVGIIYLLLQWRTVPQEICFCLDSSLQDSCSLFRFTLSKKLPVQT